MVEIIEIFVSDPGRGGDGNAVILFAVGPVEKRRARCKRNDLFKSRNDRQILKLIDRFSTIIVGLNAHTRILSFIQSYTL